MPPESISPEPLFSYIKVELVETSEYYISTVLDMSGFIESLAENGEDGTKYTVSCVQMTEPEFNNLPEFTGF